MHLRIVSDAKPIVVGMFDTTYRAVVHVRALLVLDLEVVVDEKVNVPDGHGQAYEPEYHVDARVAFAASRLVRAVRVRQCLLFTAHGAIVRDR